MSLREIRRLSVFTMIRICLSKACIRKNKVQSMNVLKDSILERIMKLVLGRALSFFTVRGSSQQGDVRTFRKRCRSR